MDPTPLPVLTDAASASDLVAIVGARLSARGIDGFRPPPATPTTCCGRGCNGCVWEGYFHAVAWWRDEALLLLA